MTEWTDKQIMAARAITLIQNNLQPNCEECGYGADRPNCALGGGCARHNQADVQAYDAVIAAIGHAAEFPQDFSERWDLHMPLYLYQDFTEGERSLLMDIADGGGEFKARRLPGDYWALSKKKAVSISHQYERYTCSLTKRGRALLEYWNYNPAEQVGEST